MRTQGRLFLWTLTLAVLSLPQLVLGDRFLLEVEDFEGPWRRQTNISGYHGAGFCTSNANPKVADTCMKTSVEIAEPGEYAVFVRGYTSDNSRRAMQVEVNGKKLDVTQKGKQRRWSWEKAGTVTLPKGKVSVVVHDAAVGFESADCVLLTNDPDDDPVALEANWFVFGGKLPDSANALRYNIDRCLEHCEKHADPESKEDWEKRRTEVEAAFKKAMGYDPAPKKTPLNPQITGTADRDGYTIENLLFESMPGFYVTANVYKPKGVEGRLPAVVVTMGHAMEDGKNYDLYRSAQLSFVKQGFLVLAYDPIGQGERRIPGNAHLVSYPALMTGKSNLHYMVWDSIRALDYLQSRKDVDARRIGIAGNSGGGLNTMYTMPAEKRFAAGASFCCLCSFHAWLKDGGNHCICNHLPGIVPEMEQFEFVGLCAPRPFMSGNGQKDPIFPIAGVRETIRRAKPIYGFYEAEDAVTGAEAPLPHGWSQPLREAAAGWFAKWLQGRGDGSPIPEEEIKLEDKKSKDIHALVDGKFPKGAKTYADVVRAEAKRLVDAYKDVPEDAKEREAWRKALRMKLWETLGGKPKPFAPVTEKGKTFEWEGTPVEQVAIQTETQMKVPGLLFTPKDAKGETVILLSDAGKSMLQNNPMLTGLLKQGRRVLALDVRGLGEGSVHENHCASDAVCLGRPLLAQQAWDLIQAVKWSKENSGGPVSVVANGNVGLIAILAAALSGDFKSVTLRNTPDSFLNGIADPLPFPLWAYPANILKVADVPQLEAAAGDGVVKREE